MSTWDAVLVPAGLWICEGILIAFLAKSRRKPPLSVRFACWLEMFFGTLLAATMLLFVGEITRAILIGVAGVGLLWVLVAGCLLLGKRWARALTLALSVARLVTVVGIPFSVLDIYLLYGRKAARTFFAKE
jgi:hypothetical protein